MLSKFIVDNTLDKIIGAANSWRQAATAAGVSITQINFVLPGGAPVVFAWDSEAGDWRIDT
jgi:hypothetical protein